MTDIQLENELLQKITSFDEYVQNKKISIDEGIYSFLSDFGIFLRDAISNNEKLIVKQSFDLMNSWFSYNDIELEKKISVGILEVLTDTEESQTACINNLNSRGVAIFNNLFDRFTKLYTDP